MFRECVGDNQFGVQKDGSGRLHRLLTTELASGERICASLDLADASSMLARDCVQAEVRRGTPDAAPVVDSWLARDSTHVLRGAEGGVEFVSRRIGLDQGCPPSAQAFLYCH